FREPRDPPPARPDRDRRVEEAARARDPDPARRARRGPLGRGGDAHPRGVARAPAFRGSRRGRAGRPARRARRGGPRRGSRAGARRARARPRRRRAREGRGASGDHVSRALRQDRHMTEPVPPPAEVIIGVDVGTTAAKVAAFGLAAPWRHVAVREYPLLEPRPGFQVQDPETIAAAMLSALTDAVAAARGATVLALSVSTAMHGLIGLDERLVPVTPLLTWADARSAGEAAGLRASG